MTAAPDLLDALKYAVAHARDVLEFVADEAGQHDATSAAADLCDALRKELARVLDSFTTDPADANTYSDGTRVSTHLSSGGHTRVFFHRPPVQT